MAAISLKCVKIEEKLLWRTYMYSALTLGEVENERTCHKLVVFAISLCQNVHS